MHVFFTDLRYAARRLLQAPLFTISAAAVLALGIGLNAVVFNVVDSALFRPAPFTDTEHLVHIYQDADNGAPTSTSFPAYRDMAAMSDVFSGVAATTTGTARWDRPEGPRQVAVQYTTASYLPVLGLEPYLGRWFEPAHDHVGAGMAAVVSHAAWRTRFGADPDVVGSTVRLNNEPVTIIGVGPRGFNGWPRMLVTDFWLSISSTPVGGPFQVANLEHRNSHWYQVKARLAEGVSLEQARTAIQGLEARLAETYPDLNAERDITVFAHDQVRVHPLADAGIVAGGVTLFVVAGLVLLLACSNLANLLLARGLSRLPELAVRAALGADRARIVRLLLLESLLLSMLGAAAGLALAGWAASLLARVSFPLAQLPGSTLDVGFDVRVAIFGVVTALVTGLLFGLVPALRSAHTDVAASLRDEGRGHTPERRASALRKGLVAAQVAISIVLVIAAGLLGRSLANVERADPGVDAERIAVIGTDLAQGGVSEDEAGVVAGRILERVAALPGVERAALTTRLPVQSWFSTTQIVDGYTPASGTGAVEIELAAVSPGYFETMGIPVQAGRTFTSADRAGARSVVVVNEAAARAYWSGDAVGGRIRGQSADSDWHDVVGVVADVNVNEPGEAPTPMLYRSTAQFGVGSFSVVARTSGDPAALLPALRGALRDVRATLPVTRALPLETHFGDALAVARAGTALMGGFSILALLLASIGIYAVVAFTVGRRTQELGIRAALGATGAGLVRLVVRESLGAVGLGLVLGLLVAALAMRGLDGVLFGVGAVDVPTFAAAAVLLVAVAGLAAYLPARRAAAANPIDVLRRP